MKIHLNEFSLLAQMCRVLNTSPIFFALLRKFLRKRKMKTHWLLCTQTMKIHLNEFSLSALFVQNLGNQRIWCPIYRHTLNKLSSFQLVLGTKLKICTYFLNILNYLLEMKTHWLLCIQTIKAHLNEFPLPAQMWRVLELLYSSLPYSQPEKNEKMKTHWLLNIQTMKIHLNEFSLTALLTQNPGNNLGTSFSNFMISTNQTTFT